MNKHLTVQNIVITVLVIFFMMIGAIGTGMFKCTNNVTNQKEPYKFVDKNGEVVLFTPKPNDKNEGKIVIAFITNGYFKVDVLPKNTVTDMYCSVTPIKKSFNLFVECADLEHKFPFYRIYDSTAKSSFGFVGYVEYVSLPAFIDEFRYSLRRK